MLPPPFWTICMFLSRTVCEKSARTVCASRMNAFRLPIAEAPATLAIDQSKKRQDNFWKKFMKCFLKKKKGARPDAMEFRVIGLIEETANVTTVLILPALTAVRRNSVLRQLF